MSKSKLEESSLRIQRDLAIALGSTTNLTEALERILDAALGFKEISCGCAFVVDSDSGSLDLVYHKGLQAQHIRGLSHFPSDSHLGRLAVAGKDLFGSFEDLFPSEDFHTQFPDMKVASLLPISKNSEVIALLVLASPSHEAFQPEMRQALETMTRSLGNVVARVKSESAQRVHEKNLQTLFDSMEDFLCILDRNGRILLTNSAVEKRLSYSSSELYNMTINDIHDVEHGSTGTPVTESLLNGSSKSVSFTNLIARDGTRIPVETRFTYGKWGGRDAIFGVSREVSDEKIPYKLLEKDLLNLPNTIAGLLNATEELVIYHDTDLKILWANEASGDSVNVKSEELIGRYCYEIWHDRSEPCESCPVAKSLETGTSRDAEIFSPDDRVWWVRAFPVFNDNDQIVGAVEFCTDITARKRSEDALRESEERYRVLFENAAIGIGVSTLDGCVISYNQAMLETMGFTTESARNLNLKNVYKNPGDREMLIDRLQRYGFVKDFECTMIKDDGQEFTCELNVVPITLKGERVLLTMAQDITARRKSEDAIRESEAKYSNLFHRSYDAVFIHDLNGKIIDANQKALDMLGFNSEDLRNMSVKDLHPPDQLEISRRAFKEIQSKGSIECDINFRTKTGEVIPCELRSNIFELYGQEIIQGIVRDISERRTSEAALKSSEERYRTLYETANDAIFLMDAEVFVECNKKTLEVFGCQMSDVVGKSPYDFSPETQPNGENSQELAKKKVNLALEGQTQSFEWVHLRPDGTEFDAEVHLSRMEVTEGQYLLAIVRDVTARKLAERALRESEEQFRIAFHTNPDSVNINRQDDGTYVDVNSGFERLTGYMKEEVIGKSSSDINIWYDDNDRMMLRKGLQECGSVHNMEARFRLKSGEIRAGLISANIIHLNNEPHILSVTRDVENWRRAQEALRSSEAAMKSILTAAPIGIGLVRDREFVWVSDQLCRLVGYSSDELIGQSAKMLYESEDEFQRVGNQKYKEIDRSGTGEVETRFVCKDGHVKDILLRSTPIDVNDLSAGVTFTASDITEQKHAAKELRASEQRYRALIESAPIPILVQSDDSILYANNAAIDALGGNSTEEIVGRTIWDFVSDESRDSIIRLLTSSKGNGVSTPLIEERFLRTDGAVIDVQVTSSSIAYLGKPSSQIVFSDITERKKGERLLRETTEELKAEREALNDKNIALTQVLDHIEEERQDYKQRICQDIETAVEPVIDKIKERASQDGVKSVENLETSLKAILAQDVDVFRDRYSKLTPREIQICELIKQGKSSKQIAEEFNTSVLTVHKHREKIRKKLGIANKNVNLTTYLQTH